MYSHQSLEPRRFFFAHDAEGAVYAFFRLSEIFPDGSVERERYISLGVRMAELWLKIMATDPNEVRSKGPGEEFPGWPPVWRYRLNKFLPGDPPQIEVTPLPKSWLGDSVEESRSQALGADFFRIDHIPHGLLMAYRETGNRTSALPGQPQESSQRSPEAKRDPSRKHGKGLSERTADVFERGSRGRKELPESNRCPERIDQAAKEEPQYRKGYPAAQGTPARSPGQAARVCPP